MDAKLPKKRPPRVGFGTAIQTDGQSTHLKLNLSVPNLTGICDKINLALKTRNLPKIHAIDFDYTIPFKLPYNPLYSIGYSQFINTSLPGAYDQEDKSFIHRLDLLTSPFLKHSFSFINTWTHIKCSSIETPLEIREQSGHFLKSYLKYEIKFDKRSQENFHSNGVFATFASSISTNLFKKGAKFTKHEAQVQFNKLLLPQRGLFGQINVFAGTLLRASKIDISDKFFLGGVPTFRGFKTQSFGPHVRGYPLGDVSYLTGGVHLYPILPGTTTKSKINDFIRPNLFVNVGTSGDLNKNLRFFSDFNFSDSLRCSCGLGLVAAFMGIRLELNYCVPIRTMENDLVVPGLQFGFYTER